MGKQHRIDILFDIQGRKSELPMKKERVSENMPVVEDDGNRRTSRRLIKKTGKSRE